MTTTMLIYKRLCGIAPSWPPRRTPEQRVAEALPWASANSQRRAIDALDLARYSPQGGGCTAARSREVDALDLATPHALRPILSRAVAWLNATYPLVRLGLPTALYYGHQSAAVAIARRLRTLGYRGWLEFAPTPASLRKLPMLLPGTVNSSWRTQTFAAARVRLSPRAHKPTPLAMFGGLDNTQQGWRFVRAETCLVLQPLHWPQRFGLVHRGRFWPQPKEAGAYQDGLPPPVSVAGVLEQSLDRGEHAKCLPGLLHVVTAVQTGAIDLLTVYGLHRSPPQALERLLKGIRQAQTQRAPGSKLTVVLVVTPQPTTWPAEYIPACDAAAVRRMLRRAKPADVRVMTTGAMPQPAFLTLLHLSTWAPAVEGANSTNFLRLRGLPYLSLSDRLTPVPDRGPGDRTAARVRAATAALRAPPGTDTAPIASFLLAARQPTSPERAYFAALGESMRHPAHDAVGQGLVILHRCLRASWPPRRVP